MRVDRQERQLPLAVAVGVEQASADQTGRTPATSHTDARELPTRQPRQQSPKHQAAAVDATED